MFEAFQREMNEFSLKKLSDTRWFCRAEALRVLRLRLEEVKLTLEEIADNDHIQSGNSESLLKAISTFDFVFTLIILEEIFTLINTTVKLADYSTRVTSVTNLTH